MSNNASAPANPSAFSSGSWNCLNLRSRYWIYAAATAVFLCLALLSAAARRHITGEFDLVVTDAEGYYAYLPSLLIDGDLDFSNQIRTHYLGATGPLSQDDRTPLGYVRNKYPAGLAFTLAPAFLLARLLGAPIYSATHWQCFTQDGYSAIFQMATLLEILLLGFWTMILVDRLVVWRFQVHPGCVLAGILVYWFGSHYAYYYFREPFMVHAVSCFWVTISIFAIEKIRASMNVCEFPISRWTIAFAAFAMALVCRPTNIFLVAFFAVLSFELWSRNPGPLALKLLPALLPAGAIAFLQMLIWHRMNGSFLYYSYEGEGFNWTSPALWQTLFSSRHGLFFWSPLLLFSAWGFGRYLWKQQGWKDPLIASYVAAFLILWCLNSSWYCWWFGGAFGARAFLELSSLFIIGLVFFFEQLRNAAPLVRKIAFVAIALCVSYSWVLMLLYMTKRIPREDYLLQIFHRF